MKQEPSEAFPFVSVIIAVYNGEKFLKQTLKSIIDQTYINYEIIVIDGGSKDGTLDIIKEYGHYITFWLSEPDKGIYNAWNKAIKIAKGDWLCFLGSDDVLLPSALEAYTGHILKENLFDYEFISSRIQFVNNDLSPRTLFGRKWNWTSHKIEMRVAHVGALHNKSLFMKYGLFNENYKIAGDYELLLRPKSKLKASFIDEITVLMRCEGASNTNSQVFKEALKAKVETAGRNRYICGLEYYYMLLKFNLLKIARP